jgi:hypothetical protein
MNTTTNPVLPKPRFLRSVELLSLAVFVVLHPSLLAQSVMVPSPSGPATPRIIQANAPEGTSSDDADSGRAIEMGQIRLRPLLSARYVQADDLPIGSGLRINTNIITVNAGLTAELGQHWSVSFNPTWINYSSNLMESTVNHSFALNGATLVNDWDLQLSQSYLSSNDVIAETAAQTEQETWQTTLSAASKVGQHSRYEGSFGYSKQDATLDTLPSASESWTTAHWLKNQFTPRLNVGLGVNLGWVELSQRPDTRYHQYLGRIEWQPIEKINVNLEGGMDNRYTTGSSQSSPTLKAALDYRPFAQTSISLSYSQVTEDSVYEVRQGESKGWSIALNQRLLGKLQLNLNYQDSSREYTDFGTSVGVSRSDEVRSFGASLSVLLYQRINLAVVFQSSENKSDQAGLSYSTSQYGLEMGVRF